MITQLSGVPGNIAAFRAKGHRTAIVTDSNAANWFTDVFN